MLMAGLDGIKNKIDPTKAGFGPINKNIYHLPDAEKAKIKSVPGSLDESLAALENDHKFLTQGEVFSDELHPELDRLQADERDRPGQDQDPPVRDVPVLRRVNRWHFATRFFF